MASFQIYERPQVQQRPTTGALFGQALGQGLSGLGQGFGSVLSNMAENKLKQMYAQQQEQGFSNALQKAGYSADLAPFINHPQVFSSIMKANADRPLQEAMRGLYAPVENAGMPASQPVQPAVNRPIPVVSQNPQGAGQPQQPGAQMQPGLPQQAQNVRPQAISPRDAEAAALGLITPAEIANRKNIIGQVAGLPGGLKQAQQMERDLNGAIANKVAWLKNQEDRESKKEEHALNRELKVAEHKEKKEQKEQEIINKENAKQKTELETRAAKFKPVVDLLDDYEAQLDSKKPITGWATNIFPIKELMPTETRKLYDMSKQLVNLVGSSEVKGVMSKARQKLLEEAKLNINQSYGEQKEIIRRFREQFQPDVIKNQIKDQIIEDNGGTQPRNLMGLVNKRYKEQYGESKTVPEQNLGEAFDSLPAANTVPGKKFYDEESKKTYISDGLKWKVV